MKPSLVLCLGNEILADDAFGPRACEMLQAETDLSARADVIYAPLAGFNLLEILSGRSRALIVDTIVTEGNVPGTIHRFPLCPDAPAHNLTCSHQISLPAALTLGRKLGYPMPAEVDVLAVEAADLVTLGAALTPAVEASLPTVAAEVRRWVQSLPPPAGESPALR